MFAPRNRRMLSCKEGGSLDCVVKIVQTHGSECQGLRLGQDLRLVEGEVRRLLALVRYRHFHMLNS